MTQPTAIQRPGKREQGRSQLDDATRREARRALDACAVELGLDLVGVASVARFQRGERVAQERLRSGLMGQLPWYTEERVRRGARPRELLPGARSIISVAMSYLPQSASQDTPPGPLRGRVARYAWGRDYHNVLKKRLRRLGAMLEERLGRPIQRRVYVDDGPMLDREVARRAGIGFFGKNSNILTNIGSWVFLGQIITDLELPPDRPSRKSCGACTACMPACPTGAIVAPYVIDSNRCIAYLTIEHRGPIPLELRAPMGDRVFGCDICQEVCPVNVTRGQPSGEPAFRAPQAFSVLDLTEVLALDEEAFRARFLGSPIRRATRIGLQRNACVVLGNLGDPAAIPALAEALRGGDPLVRGHAAWALGRLGGTEAAQALETRRGTEQDSWVNEEIVAAIDAIGAEAA
jgi:epoxyqueuosine reductase